MKPLYAGIEAGGTKFVCALGNGESRTLLDRAVFPTERTPQQTIAACVDWLKQQQARRGAISALGIASFGPVDLDPASPLYGAITTTPKPGWQNTHLVSAFRQALSVPIGFDTDVNGAALGEHVWGAGQGIDNLVYLTMGTGIGGGALVGGRLVHGLIHPEMGHMRLKRAANDAYPGMCYAHGDCWEGLCCGPAIAARAGAPAESLAPDHPIWQAVANETAQALHNILMVLSPQRIILGGSVPKAGKLGADTFFAVVRKALIASLNGYLNTQHVKHSMTQFLVPPALGDDAGVCGALALAMRALAA